MFLTFSFLRHNMKGLHRQANKITSKNTDLTIFEGSAFQEQTYTPTKNRHSVLYKEKDTTIVYNSNTLKLTDSGNFEYSQRDNPRLRRVVWGVFEVKDTGKRFAVTSTHLDLLREGKEQELTEVMQTQAKELIEFDNNTYSKYDCPVISVGDYNTMEDTPQTKAIDSPAIYNELANNLNDSKFSCEHQICGTEQAWLYPSYDHIFIKGEAKADTFALLSYKWLSDMSDHYPVFADIAL